MDLRITKVWELLRRFKTNCKKEWTNPKEELVCMDDKPDACPNCGSTDISYESVEKAIVSSGAYMQKSVSGVLYTIA